MIEKDLAAPQGFEPRYADPELSGEGERFSDDLFLIQSLASAKARTEARFVSIKKARIGAYRFEAYGTVMAQVGGS